MPNYKLVDADKLESDLTVVADAIKAKAEIKEKLSFPDGMADAVEGIESDPKIDGYHSIKIGETINLSALSEDCELNTPGMDGGWYSTGDNEGVIGVTPETEWYVIEGLSKGTTIFTMNYHYDAEEYDENDDTIIVTKERTLRYVVTVTSGGGQIYVDAVFEVKVGETISLSTIGEGEAEAGTPTMTLLSRGEDPSIIYITAVPSNDYPECLDVQGVTEGKTIITYEYYTEKWEDNYLRTVNVQINVVPGGGSTESDAEYQYEDTVSVRPGDTTSVALPCPYDSPGGSDYTIISGGHLIESIEEMVDLVEIMAANDIGTAVIRFDYGSYNPERDGEVSCTLILTVIIEE